MNLEIEVTEIDPALQVTSDIFDASGKVIRQKSDMEMEMERDRLKDCIIIRANVKDLSAKQIVTIDSGLINLMCCGGTKPKQQLKEIGIRQVYAKLGQALAQRYLEDKKDIGGRPMGSEFEEKLKSVISEVSDLMRMSNQQGIRGYSDLDAAFYHLADAQELQ